MNRRATVVQLTTQMDEGATNTASATTIQRMLLHMGPSSRHLVNASMLTDVHWRRMLEFARQYLNWTLDEWLQVISSD